MPVFSMRHYRWLDNYIVGIIVVLHSNSLRNDSLQDDTISTQFISNSTVHQQFAQ